jgi:hypothetical protein
MTPSEISTPSARSVLFELFGHKEAWAFDQNGATVTKIYTDIFHGIYFLIECPEHQLADANREFMQPGRDDPLNECQPENASNARINEKAMEKMSSESFHSE